MKQSLFITLSIIAALAMFANSQSPYDPYKEYNVTYIDWWPYDYSLLRICQIPSPDGKYCLQCKSGATRQDRVLSDQTIQYGFCMFDFLPDDCYAYDLNLNCVLCHDGFWMNTSLTNDRNLCKPKTYGCQIYDPAIKKCNTCMPGWTMNTTINGASNLSQYYCYFVADPNCLSYDSNNICLGCVANYALKDNRCAFVSATTIANCAQISGTVCAKCNIGYYITNDGKCSQIPAISNCQTQVDFTCSSCIAGYTLANNACSYVIADCAQVTGTVCSKCNTNFQITLDGKCSAIAKIPNCASQVDYTCSSCVTGYSLSNNQCTFIIDNCAIVTGVVCSKCNTNFEVTSEGKCSPIAKIPNCASQIDYTCQSCSLGWALSNNQCSYIIENCATVNGMTCSKCNTDYSVTSDGKCSYIPRIINCASQVDFTCQSCLTNFVLSSNKCITAIEKCQEYNGAICSKCATNYQLTATFTCSLIPRISNCLIQVDTQCNLCNTGFCLINNTCIVKIDNCLKITGTVCDQCSEGFIISEGKCITDPFYGLDLNCKLYDKADLSKCIACSAGFFLNTKKKCEQVDPLCKMYNSTNGFCLSCYVGYGLQNGKCYKPTVSPYYLADIDFCNQYDWNKNVCVKCAEGCYFDAQGKCQKYIDDNCKTPSKDLKTCSQCYQGYSFNSTQGKCAPVNYNCASWANGKCATCPVGYYLSEQFQCILSDPNCYIFNKATKTCVLCYPGYVADTDKKCKPLEELNPNVVKYTQNCSKIVDGKCTECYNGYYIAKDSVGSYCAKASDLCKAYNKTNGKCYTCYLGYYLSTQGECLRYF